MLEVCRKTCLHHTFCCLHARGPDSAKASRAGSCSATSMRSQCFDTHAAALSTFHSSFPISEAHGTIMGLRFIFQKRGNPFSFSDLRYPSVSITGTLAQLLLDTVLLWERFPNRA